MKKAQSLSLNTIVIAALVLIVFVVLVFIFTGRISIFAGDVSSCESQGGTCSVTECDVSTSVKLSFTQAKCSEKLDANNQKIVQYCCIPLK